MATFDPRDPAACLARIQRQLQSGNYRLSLHAEDERAAEETGFIERREIAEAIERGEIIENYPDDMRGPSCLLYGRTAAGRPLHLVCTTSRPRLIIITVYEPTPPAWTTPRERR